jgi:hypothetical protein
MISRRVMLRSLLSLPIAATLDVEQLLWIPKQLIVVPAGVPRRPISYAEIADVVHRLYHPALLRSLFLQHDPLLGHITDQVCVEEPEAHAFVMKPLPPAVKGRPVSFLVRDRPRIVVPAVGMNGELPVWTTAGGASAYGSYTDDRAYGSFTDDPIDPPTDRFFAGD